MHINIDTARICHIIHTSNIGRHNVLGSVGELIVWLNNTGVEDVDGDVVGVVGQLCLLVSNLNLDRIEAADNLPEGVIYELVITIYLMLY